MPKRVHHGHEHTAPPAGETARWLTSDSASLYRVAKWGAGYFGINDQGHVTIRPGREPEDAVSLHEIVTGLYERGIQTPVLLRFPDIVEDRLRTIHDAFAKAIEENDYQGSYQAVFPIKVNQQHQVVNEIARYGRALGFGLEVGSKPELLAVMALTVADPDQLIVCNGFKDGQYIEAVILAHKLGRRIIPVIENLRELDRIIATSKRYGVRPSIGIRVKLAARGSGHWGSSTGFKSKFGLSTTELLRAVETLEQHDMLDCLDLLHCHSGSQHQNIATIKSATTELSHVFVRLRSRGAKLSYLDVGGGLGVDYQGLQTDAPSSMNYTLAEYASDMVYRICSVCQAAGQSHPTIVTECGRAMVAHSSVLVFDVLGSSGPSDIIDHEIDLATLKPDDPQPIRDLGAALAMVREDATQAVVSYHDALRAREESISLFSLGYLSLEQRALSEKLFWTACAEIQQACAQQLPIPDELTELNELMSEVYLCNFSLFQSLPDSWAIDQLFPIMPIHQLDKEPVENAVLADMTCDSDGQIETYLDSESGIARSLPVHSLDSQENYYLGVFLVGAYQETLGDLHNLFGDAHTVHIKLDQGQWVIDDLIRGDTVRAVLGYVQYNADDLARALERECEIGVRNRSLTVPEARTMRQFYETGLSGYTYLDPDIELT